MSRTLGMKLWLLNALVSSAALAAGCATNTLRFMALNDETSALDLGEESLVLMTVKTSNLYKPAYQPGIVEVHVDGETDEETQSYTFSVPSRWQSRHRPDRTVKNASMEFLVSLSLPPGKYLLRKITGYGGKVPIISRGLFRIPVFGHFEIGSNEVVYLGRLDATNRKREEDSELRAGPPVPVVDQALSGFGDGTFDVRIKDQYDRDVARFKERYPILNDHMIQRAVLTPGTQPTIKEWDWEVMK